MPSLLKSSFVLFLSLILFMVIGAWFPTPTTVLLVAGLLSLVVLLQVYLILKDTSMPPTGSVRGNYEHH